MGKIKNCKVKRITPRNYKKCGYDHYYKFGKNRFRYTIDDSDGYERIYDSKGKFMGEFS